MNLAQRALRARHNDMDYTCKYWWGDRYPGRDDRANREIGGAPTLMADRRCLVCRPYSEDGEVN